MTYSDIHAKLTDVFRDLFEDPSLQISDATSARDVQGWDSLAHVNLVVATEKAFGLSFTTKEVMALANVGDLIRLIERRAK